VTLYIAIEPVSSQDNPCDHATILPVACSTASGLVFMLAYNGHDTDDADIYRCEPLTSKEKALLWADLEARQNVCRHLIPLPGHPDWDPEVACVSCMAQEALLQRADYEYDRAKDR
jgi:hypothetical protein